MTEQWQELKETIIELRDNDGTGTQQEICKFLVNYMDVLEKQMQEPCEDAVSRQWLMRKATERFYITNYFNHITKMIEEAPPVRPQDPSGNLISREVVLDEINRVGVKGFETYNDYSQLYDFVDTLPSGTPQPKTGHWIRGHHGFGCSNCHKSIEGEWDDNIDDITGTLFCPNCGAKMESEE